ncbi:MarR family winged helix-turn-helix transcriptional regulator [Brevibacillus daliensis]|uniref:MarR family winged helix-turn-helix transcriptional regulator n=1 Tax=Brevibacillus daliensis TaxID=2892995 RepID=UPI001E4D53AC|nr:MarR family transcriptional regulator [Brevibacillus daliensis]
MNIFEEDLLPEEVDTLKRLTDFPIDFAAMSICSNIYRAAQRLRVTMERDLLANYSLSWTGFDLLHNLWIWEWMESRGLAKSMGVTVATISSISNTLERKNLVQRRVNPRDRRLVELGITDQGRQVMEDLFPKFNQGEVDMIKGLTEEEQKKLLKLLRRVIKNIE